MGIFKEGKILSQSSHLSKHRYSQAVTMLPPKSAVCSDPGPPLSSEGVVGTAQSVPAIKDSCQGAARARRHLPAVLPALHQRARGSRLGGLPCVPGADCAAGLPGSPRATERDLLPTHEAGLLPPAAEVLPHAGGRP